MARSAPETVLSKPSPDYAGYVNIADDLNGEIAGKRLAVLQEGRSRLTDELTSNQVFYEELDRLSASLWPKRETLSEEQKERIDSIRNRFPSLASEVLGREITGDEIKDLGLDKIAEAFFLISQEMPPLYLGFAKELVGKSEELGTSGDDPKLTFLFSGRDSFPFLLGFRKYAQENGVAGKDIYAPFNRVGFQKFFGTRENEREFLKDLEDFYTENGIDGSHMFVIDFGFIGSLERINQIILPDGVRASDMHHFLFVGFKKTGREPWFLDRLRSMKYPTEKDPDQIEKTFGYLNELVERYPEDQELVQIMTGGMDPNIDWKPYLNPFNLFFQELGSGINETRQDNIARGDRRAYKGTHLKFAPLQHFVAIYSFLEGLSSAMQNRDARVTDEEAIASLKFIYRMFENYRPFFQEFIPQEDRRHLDDLPSSPQFKLVTEELEELQTIPISTVKFPKPGME